MPDLDPKPGEANPLVWAAVAGGFAAVVMLLNGMIGTPPSENPLLETPASSAVVAAFIGWAAANIKNWLGRR